MKTMKYAIMQERKDEAYPLMITNMIAEGKDTLRLANLFLERYAAEHRVFYHIVDMREIARKIKVNEIDVLSGAVRKGACSFKKFEESEKQAAMDFGKICGEIGNFQV